jgi:hypothetical protein
MWSFLRHLLAGPTPAISEEEALRIASQECERKGFPVENPEATPRRSVWVIASRPEIPGAPIITVDNQTGEVLSFTYLRR